MGVDTRIYLPPPTQVTDVADVVGILLGLPKQQRPLGSSSHPDAWFVRVDGAKVEAAGEGLEMCAYIACRKDDELIARVMYHFETKRGERLLMPGSTAKWIAVGRALVDFFGGRIIYNDHGDMEDDYMVPARRDIHAEDGKPWQDFQQRKWELEPLTRAQIAVCRKYAAYTD